MKKNYLLLISAAVIILAGCNGSKSSTDAVTLKLNLEKGKTYLYGLATHLDMNMTMMGQKMATGLDMAYYYKLGLDGQDSAGNNIMNSRIDGIKFKAEVMGMSMGYDSKEVIDTSHQDAMSGMFRKMSSGMIGQSFKITIAPTGTILNVTGVEGIISGMINGLPGSDEEKAKMRQQLNQSFNPEQVKQSFSQAFNIYPDKPVKIGDTWVKSMDMSLAGTNSKQNVTYKVKDITSSSVVLDMDGKMGTATTNPGDSTTTGTKSDVSGTEKGTMTFDRTSGLATSGDIDLVLAGSIEMKGTKMPMDIKGKITITGK